jgi:hypothetical protein
MDGWIDGWWVFNKQVLQREENKQGFRYKIN